MSAYGADKAGAPVGPGGPDREASDVLPSLARYTVHQKLAVGGMATVFLAQKEGSSDICVIKQLHPHLAEEGVVASRFMREAQVSFHLHHTNIAKILDSKREGGLLYLAIEYIPGQDVESMMFKLMEQRKMLPPELSVTVTLDVLAGLAYAHGLTGPDGRPLEIVHRDLSPRNVMVSYSGQVKIIDFGLARTNLGDFRTAPGMVLGTLRYMSPEQAVAEPVDRRSDIYSWSVVLYEMLSGRPLVMGANAQEILRAVVTQVPPPLSKLNPNLPKALDEVLERGLAKDRRDRFKTAEEMRSALLAAAGPLGSVDAERHALIGRFVRELFPDAAAESDAMLQSVQNEGGGFEPTRVLPTPHDMNPAEYMTRLQTVARAVESTPPEVMELTRAVTRATTVSRHRVTAQSVVVHPQDRRMILALVLAVIAGMLILAAVLVQSRQSVQIVESVPSKEQAKPMPVAQRSSDVTPVPEAGEPPQEATAAIPRPTTSEVKKPQKRGERPTPTPPAPATAPPAPATAPSADSVESEIESLLKEATRSIEADDRQVPAALTRAGLVITNEGKRAEDALVESCLSAAVRGTAIQTRPGRFKECWKSLRERQKKK